MGLLCTGCFLCTWKKRLPQTPLQRASSLSATCRQMAPPYPHCIMRKNHVSTPNRLAQHVAAAGRAIWSSSGARSCLCTGAGGLLRWHPAWESSCGHCFAAPPPAPLLPAREYMVLQPVLSCLEAFSLHLAFQTVTFYLLRTTGVISPTFPKIHIHFCQVLQDLLSICYQYVTKITVSSFSVPWLDIKLLHVLQI